MECCVYLITGMNGAALSNTASLLASRFDKGVHLRGDIFKRMIVSGREDMTDEPTDEAIRQLFLRFKLAAEVAVTYLNNGFHVVLQEECTDTELAHLRRILKQVPVKTVVLCAGEALKRERENFFRKITCLEMPNEKTYEQVVMRADEEVFFLDVTDFSPESAVDYVLGHFSCLEEERSRQKESL